MVQMFVIGLAAVQGGLVSNVMVIIVSITTIASFIVSNYDLSSSIRLILFPMMLFAYFFGILGIVSRIMILFAHFVTLTSYGSPYALPFAPLNDSFIKFLSTVLNNRSSIEKRNKKENY
ncbi:spore germination protein [Bacillus thuringiensis]|nr:spore germination protein [Bacillus thuringiensis]MEC2473199.1 spore germination protein [Bacillus thuringiensis]MEC2564671.1 spore germination protein [Bacillus thuringiensis]MEC2726678.1 spore germination protein [Bacillus thuringiensis]MEC2768952.1 spore germination protein [Bacillus thuringiensis]MEC2784688.1 spore germination protein [Bacillus thuringiensis]